MDKDRLFDRCCRFWDDVVRLQDRAWRLAEALDGAGEPKAAASLRKARQALQAASAAIVEGMR